MTVRQFCYFVLMLNVVYLAACTREAPVTVYVASDGSCHYAATGGEADDSLCGVTK